MTPRELSDKIEAIVSEVTAGLSLQITSTQQALYDQMRLLLNRLELDQAGQIKISQLNRALITKADEYFNRAFNQSGYYAELDTIAAQVVNITEATLGYYELMGVGATIDAQYLRSLQRNVIEQLSGLLANEGLEVALRQPILSILNQNINTSAAYVDLLDEIKDFVLGTPELQGKLQRYASQITTDALFNYSRALQESISSIAGLEFVIYSGGVTADTREFCLERSEQYFHKREVEAWADLDWAGKRAGTTASTIFIYAGGYRCAHQIIYVSEVVVPAGVKERAQRLGFYGGN